MSKLTKSDDPAFILLLDNKVTVPKVHKEDCYICEDSEFGQMGLPLCYACKKCGGHVAADDTICDDCGHDQEENKDDC